MIWSGACVSSLNPARRGLAPAEIYLSPGFLTHLGSGSQVQQQIQKCRHQTVDF